MLAPQASPPNLKWQSPEFVKQQAVNQANAKEKWFQRETNKMINIFVMIIYTHIRQYMDSSIDGYRAFWSLCIWSCWWDRQVAPDEIEVVTNHWAPSGGLVWEDNKTKHFFWINEVFRFHSFQGFQQFQEDVQLLEATNENEWVNWHQNIETAPFGRRRSWPPFRSASCRPCKRISHLEEKCLLDRNSVQTSLRVLELRSLARSVLSFSTSESLFLNIFWTNFLNKLFDKAFQARRFTLRHMQSKRGESIADAASNGFAANHPVGYNRVALRCMKCYFIWPLAPCRMKDSCY